jgi:hypothetical protein
MNAGPDFEEIEKVYSSSKICDLINRCHQEGKYLDLKKDWMKRKKFI